MSSSASPNGTVPPSPAESDHDSWDTISDSSEKAIQTVVEAQPVNHTDPSLQQEDLDILQIFGNSDSDLDDLSHYSDEPEDSDLQSEDYIGSYDYSDYSDYSDDDTSDDSSDSDTSESDKDSFRPVYYAGELPGTASLLRSCASTLLQVERMISQEGEVAQHERSLIRHQVSNSLKACRSWLGVFDTSKTALSKIAHTSSQDTTLRKTNLDQVVPDQLQPRKTYPRLPPELWHQIFLCIATRKPDAARSTRRSTQERLDLLSCTMVNSTFANAALPVLWSHAEIQSKPRMIKLLTWANTIPIWRHGSDNTQTYGDLVRSLQIYSPAANTANVFRMTSTIPIHFKNLRAVSFQFALHLEDLGLFVENCPNLVAFAGDLVGFWSTDEDKDRKLCYERLERGISKLLAAEFTMEIEGDERDLDTLVRFLSPSMRFLSLNWDISMAAWEHVAGQCKDLELLYLDSEYMDLIGIQTIIDACPKLRQCSLAASSLDKKTLLTLFTRCPLLQALQIEDADCDVTSAMLDTLATDFEKLELRHLYIDTSDSRPLSSKHLMSFLKRHGANLHTLTIHSRSSSLKYGAIRCIADHCKNLAALSLIHGSRHRMDAVIDYLLDGLPKLEAFWEGKDRIWRKGEYIAAHKLDYGRIKNTWQPCLDVWDMDRIANEIAVTWY